MRVFITGGSGYVGRPLIADLCARGIEVDALVRPQSMRKLPPGCRAVAGNVLDGKTFANEVNAGHTFVHLVGVPHPAPWKAREFEEIDLASLKTAVAVAQAAGVAHFVYVSVAQPAPVMKAYLRVRIEAERIIGASGLRATILRPFYILGPGHWWPLVLLPFYSLFERIPTKRASARRLRPVRLHAMVRAMVAAIEHRPERIAILDAEAIAKS